MADVKQLSLQTQNLHSLPPHIDTHTPLVDLKHQATGSRASISPKSKDPMSASKDASAQKKSRMSAQKSRDSAAKGSTMTLPGMIGGEITYTPTTHRISKAKKGKKVHACEFPGCPKVFTRAEHRKRHEANHNTSPAFQCQIDGCKKPFQRADLLTRHMERQHNIPPEPSTKSQYSRSTHSASPSLGQLGAPKFGRHGTSAASLAQSTSTMSIGSIIEPTQYHHGEYRSQSMPTGLSEISAQAPIDYLQPHQPVAPYYGADIVRPQTVAADPGFQAMVNSPMTHSPASVGPPTPAWGPTYDPVALGYVNDMSYGQPMIPYASSPHWTGTASIPQEDLTVPSQQNWPWAKVGF